MTSVKLLMAVLAAAMLLAIAGCASSTSPGGSLGDGAGIGPGGRGGAGGAGGASTTGTGAGGDIGVFADDASAAAQLLDTLIVYFAFDQSSIEPEFNDVLMAHAQYLGTHPESLIRLEGHADERGSREYNIGLGERRAQAVRRFMLLQGAGADQLTTVSYGEERPAVFGSDEEAYRLNRRVELVYR